MFKYIRIIINFLPTLIWQYFTWMLPYSRHPEKVPFEKRYNKCKKISLRLLKALKVQVHVYGIENFNNDSIKMITPNHQSLLDPVVLIAISSSPLSFVGKKEIKTQPFVGRIMKILDCEYINREDLRSQLDVLKKVKSSLVNKEKTWGIFPEGTRNKDIEHVYLQDFHPGTFKIVTQNDIDLVPTIIEGTYRPLSTKQHLKKYHVSVRFCSKINKENKSSIELCEETFNVSKQRMIELKETNNYFISKTNKRR